MASSACVGDLINLVKDFNPNAKDYSYHISSYILLQSHCRQPVIKVPNTGTMLTGDQYRYTNRYQPIPGPFFLFSQYQYTQKTRADINTVRYWYTDRYVDTSIHVSSITESMSICEKKRCTEVKMPQ